MGKNKTSKQQAAIAALLQTPDIATAAKQAGIGRRTLQRWLSENTEFQAAYREAQRQLLQGAIAQVRAACSEAVDVLREIMNNNESPSAPRVSAARAVLDTAMRSYEIEEFNNRLEELEKQLALLEGGGRR